MPHELSLRNNGEAEMFYVGDTPWHGLGTRLDAEVTSAEAIVAAGLDYRIEQQKLFRQDPATGALKEYPNRFAIVRTDTAREFDIVSGSYEVLQNDDQVALFDEIVSAGQAVYHTAGALRGGRVIWFLVKLPETLEVVAGDPIEKYVLMSSSHDRSKSLEIATTPIRTVCANTLRVALGMAQDRVQIKHTASIHDRAVEAREALHLTDVYYQMMMEGLTELARARMTTYDMEQYATAFLNVHPEQEELHAFSRDAHDRMCDLFETGRGQHIPGVRGTAYAALNATTEFVDNYRRVQVPQTTHQHSLDAQDRRLYRSWFGRGQLQRDRSFGLLQRFATSGVSVFDGVYTPRQRRRVTRSGAVVL